MKKTFTYSLYILACISVAVACKPKLDTPAADKGSLDLTTYVAVGNSITSGYADNALYYAGQQVSYANLLSQQFQLAGGGAFKIPYMSVNSVGVGSTGGARLTLMPYPDCNGVVSLSPVPVAAVGDTLAFYNNIYATAGPFNNMGVPGAKSIHVVYPGYGNPSNGKGNFNPFFTRMASNPATASMLSDALLLHPTFFSLFIGNNDVLLYALSGGTTDTPTPPTGTAGVGFDGSINAIIGGLMSSATKGVVGNIPDITSLPHFTTVPYNGLALTRQGQVDSLNGAYAPLGISFQLGQNPFIIADSGAPGGVRKILSTEYVLLSVPQDSLKCHKMGSQIPIPDKYILTASEIATIKTSTTAFNSTLSTAATNNGLAFVDVNAFLKSAISGITFDGINVNTTFVSGGAFSLDGVHLTPLGNALLANQFITSINSKYGSSIPYIDATKYSGVKFP